MVSAYSKLKDLRQSFDSLVDAVQRIAQTERQGRDFETKIEQESHRLSATNVAQIKKDLEAIQAENADMIAQIKKSVRK